MQALLIAPEPAARQAAPGAGRILLIEPDPQRARRLSHILRAHIRADLEAVGTADAALQAIQEHVPDLVLTSTFLPPADEGRLNAQLRATPGAAHVQVVNVPHFIDDQEGPETSARKVLSFLGRRTASNPLSCDPTTVIEDINAYLEQSRARREAASDGAASTALVQRPTGVVLAAPSQVGPYGAGHVDDRRRARRRPSTELPWLWAVKLPWGTEVKVVDISNRGVLVESPSKLTAGSTLDLQLVGQGTQLQVPARMVRSEIAGVDGLGVRYRVAAAFARDLEIPGLAPRYPAAALTPRALGDLLSRVMAEVDRCAKPAEVRARFERELRELLPVRDVQIRLTPLSSRDDAESVLFAVPQTAGRTPFLQVTFNRDYRPSAMEFRLLKAAASLAAAVLEFAPLEGDAGMPPLTGRTH